MANTNVYQRNNENSRQRRNMHQLTHHTSLVSTYFNLGAVMDAMVVRVLSVEVMYRCIAVTDPNCRGPTQRLQTTVDTKRFQWYILFLNRSISEWSIEQVYSRIPESIRYK
jgi:hypothetical protein